jgi:hypothetical protein
MRVLNTASAGNIVQSPSSVGAVLPAAASPAAPAPFSVLPVLPVLATLPLPALPPLPPHAPSPAATTPVHANAAKTAR